MIGKTDHLELIVHNTVTAHKNNEIFLGLDWFAQTGADIFPGTKTLKFPVNEINVYLSEDNDSTDDTHNVFITEDGYDIDILKRD